MLSAHVSEEMKNVKPSVFDLIVEYKDVFVPPEWLGITGVAPLKLQFREGLPRVHKPPARPINPRLLEDCKLEFERMCGYFYRPTTSSTSCARSPLTLSPIYKPSMSRNLFLRLTSQHSSMYSHKLLPLCVFVMIVLELITS